MRDWASELRAIADGRLMLNVRNGVTVSRSMLAMIADEIDALRAAPLAPAEVGGHADAQTEARAIVDAIFTDLRDRSFLKWMFDERGDENLIARLEGGEELRGLDLDVQEEIRAAWSDIIATALAAKDAGLAAVKVSNNKWLAKWERAEAQLAEANKALDELETAARRFKDVTEEYFSDTEYDRNGCLSNADAALHVLLYNLSTARRAREAQGGGNV